MLKQITLNKPKKVEKRTKNKILALFGNSKNKVFRHDVDY